MVLRKLNRISIYTTHVTILFKLSQQKIMDYQLICKEIALKIIESGAKSKKEIAKIKKEVAKKYHLIKIPEDSAILKFSKGIKDYEKLRDALKVKPVRTLSGVAVISVMSSPERCPHGKCIPCPGGVEFNTPQSYIGYEPAAQRGKQYNYDSFKQVSSRLNELKEIGHNVDKVEVIVMGGTFIARDKKYRDEFILGIYNALNSFDNCVDYTDDLELAKKINERAKVRCIGMTFETRPDYAKEEDIIEMLKYGATKVEIGVQSIYDDVLIAINRGHDVDEVIKATKRLKDSALKVGYHIMPGLPGSDFQRDLKMFKELFENDKFRPDYLKIYPTLVVKGTKLYEMYKRGEYSPYTTEEVVELLAKAKRYFPEYVRVQRIQRDIPVDMAIGLDKGNIRQLVKRRLEEMGEKCRCIRCREIGHKIYSSGLNLSDLSLNDAEIVVRKYKASDGLEFFISYEFTHIDALIGFIRLRFPKNPFIDEIKNLALIRELHVYGESVKIGVRKEGAFQHKGVGERLLRMAEEIAKDRYDGIAVLSGVGARDYYRKHGYELNLNYMYKKLKD